MNSSDYTGNSPALTIFQGGRCATAVFSSGGGWRSR